VTTDTAVRFDSDLDLVKRAQEGDADAFATLFHNHKARIYSVCLRMTNNTAEAEDLTQDAFLQVFRKLATFRGDSALSTWLYRIAVNVCLNRVSAKRPITEPIDSAEHFEDVRSESASHALLREERAVAVRRAIASLPDKQRATLILRTYHDMSHQEIADVLGSSVGAVKANFFHALNNLKKILGSEP